MQDRKPDRRNFLRRTAGPYIGVKSAAARSSAKGAKQSRTGHSSMSSFHLIYFALLILAMGGVGEGATHPVGSCWLT